MYLADNGGSDAERLLAQLQRDFPPDFLTTHIEPMPHGQMKVLLTVLPCGMPANLLQRATSMRN